MAKSKDKKNLFGEKMPENAIKDASFIRGKGASSPWFAELLGMNRQVVNQKLSHCPKMGGKTSGSLYDPKIALQYLIEPILDGEEWLALLKKGDLPTQWSKEFWSARREKRKSQFEENELFHVEHVERMITAILLVTKEEFQTAPTEIDKHSPLAEKQIHELHKVLDKIMLKIRDRLIKLAAESNTPSVLADYSDSDENENEISTDDFFARKGKKDPPRPITTKEFLDGRPKENRT